MAKFTGNRYLTVGVQNEIPLPLQILMWSLIDKNIKKGLEMDYLQVFELKEILINGEAYQDIIHSQEVPKRVHKVATNLSSPPIIAKIFVIDSEDYVTMLLSSEY